MRFVHYGLARSDDSTASLFQTMSYCLSREIFVLCRPGDDKRVWSIARTSAKHENQNRKNFFWRGNAIFVKIWTSENFPLYGRREKVLPLPMWPGRLEIRLGLGLEYEAEEKRLEHVKYLVTGGGACGILFDVVSIAAMKQRLCADTTKIHARTPGTTARPLEEKKRHPKRRSVTSELQWLESLGKSTFSSSLFPSCWYGETFSPPPCRSSLFASPSLSPSLFLALHFVHYLPLYGGRRRKRRTPPRHCDDGDL